MKIKLMSVIKNIFLMIYILVINNMCAMDIVQCSQKERECLEKEIFNYTDTADTFIREFPLMSLNLMKYRYNRCGETTRSEIGKQLNNEENKLFKFLFKGLEPLANVFFANGKDKENNQDNTNKDNNFLYKEFLNVPMIEIKKVFSNYLWAYEAYKQKVELDFIAYGKYQEKIGKEVDLIKEQFFKKGYMFRYADEIKWVNDYLKRVKNPSYLPLADQSTVYAFWVLNKKIKEIHSDGRLAVENNKIKLCYRERLTVKNIFNNFKKHQGILKLYIFLIMLPIIGQVSRFIEPFCQKTLTPYDILFNEKAILFNAELKRVKEHELITIIKAINEIKDRIDPTYFNTSLLDVGESLLKSPLNINNPFYDLPDLCKMNVHFLPISFLLHIYCWHKTQLADRMALFVSSFFGAVALKCFSLVSLGLLEIFKFKALGFSPLEVFVYISEIFLVWACFKGICEVYKRMCDRDYKVEIEDIDQVIKNHKDGHIVIQ